MSASMRRIPRPSRVVDLAAATLPRTSTAAFATSAPRAFLLPGGKQDKKKHQQFVRRWQKRLLGDSEPIGAHVDPYDPTSPVRIAPEEQGEYEEVLDEGDAVGELAYLPVEELGADKPGLGLMQVGGEEWQQLRKERERAKEFERLTMRTYTPLTLDMADQIEDLTGTPYTLRDDNLIMAQTVHEATGRPYTHYDFGLNRKISDVHRIRTCFKQAVAEVCTLRDAGLDIDLAKSPNRGVYKRPPWIVDITIGRTETGELAVAFPKYKSAKDLVQVMLQAPEWKPEDVIGRGEVLLDEAADLIDPAVPQESAPTMDPETPAFKREAVIKIDPDKKPFDFMSNRPVPRAAPAEKPKVEEVVEEVVVAKEPATGTSPPPAIPEVEVVSTVDAKIQKPEQAAAEQKTIRTAGDAAKPKEATPTEPTSVENTYWRSISIVDPALKFALFKRLYQLTGVRISDPYLSSTKTLGELYDHLCDAAKPQSTKLFTTIHVEGQKARQRARQQQPDQLNNSRRANLGDLIKLGNVELRRQKLTKAEKGRKKGQTKVIQYALMERGLKYGQHAVQNQRLDKPVPAHRFGLDRGFRGVKEATRSVPEFGTPLPSTVANLLSKRTKQRLDELEAATK